MKVLIAVDLDEGSRAFLNDAIRLLRNTLEAVWLVHVAEPDPDFVGYAIDPTVMRDQVAEGFHREHRQLQELAESLRGEGIDATALLVQGETVKALLAQAERLDVDLLVAGCRKKKGWLPSVFGEGELTALGRPVLLMPIH